MMTKTKDDNKRLLFFARMALLVGILASLISHGFIVGQNTLPSFGDGFFNGLAMIFILTSLVLHGRAVFRIQPIRSKSNRR